MSSNQNLDVNEAHIQKLISQHISTAARFIENGTGIGTYLEALAKDDKEGLVNASDNVLDSMLCSISTLGKMMAFLDMDNMNELENMQSDLGMLFITLTDISINARNHGAQAKFLISHKPV